MFEVRKNNLKSQLENLNQVANLTRIPYHKLYSHFSIAKNIAFYYRGFEIRRIKDV